MGSTFWIEVKGRSLKETADECGKMCRLKDELDAISTGLGVATLDSFCDWTEMAAAADLEMAFLEWQQGDQNEPLPEGSRQEPTEASVQERAATGDWFDSTAGLKTIRALREHLTRDLTLVRNTTHPDDVPRYHRELLEELELFDRVLGEAIRSVSPFRILVVP
jgi:hypothetical protein